LRVLAIQRCQVTHAVFGRLNGMKAHSSTSGGKCQLRSSKIAALVAPQMQ
jgi:hypothetical protein